MELIRNSVLDLIFKHCRIGDFYRMTKQNLINGAIEYIPQKTKEGNPVTVRVPLNQLLI